MEKRKMGKERIYFRSPNINVCFKAGIAGNFSEDDFRKAIDMAAERHPLVNCVIRIDEKGDAWYLPGRSKAGLEFFDDPNPMAWREWYDKADNIPFDFESGPIVKIGVFRNGDSVDMVILGHHIIGDGIGYFNLLKDILLGLDGKPNTVPPVLPERIAFRKKTGMGFLSGYFAKKLNRMWKKTAKSFSHEDFIQFFNVYRRENPPGMYLGEIDGSKTVEVLEVCRKHGITVNEAVATALTAALQKEVERYSGKQVRLGCAANIRGELKIAAPDCMGNFVSGISVKACYDNGKPFVENAKLIGSSLRKKLRNPKSRRLVINFVDMLDEDFIESVFFAVYGNYHNRVSKKLGEILGERTCDKGLGISNLAKQNMNGHDNVVVSNIVFVPPAFPANIVNLGVITTNNHMNFCLRYSEADIDGKTVERVYHEMIGLLCRTA